MFNRPVLSILSAVSLVAGTAFVGFSVVPLRAVARPGASESTLVTVSPTRVLDTRFDVGLSGQFTASGSRKLQVTGEVDTYFEATDTRERRTVAPAGSTGVLVNLTVVAPSSRGFVSVRPGDASGDPSTSSLNFEQGETRPNAVTVQVPATGPGAGQIDISYRAGSPAATVDVIVDIVGYTTSTGLIDLANRVQALEAAPSGPPALDPARIVWVAESGGDFTSLSAAMAATTGPALIKIAPGTYTETTPVTIKDRVDIEGSGRDITTVRCACSAPAGPAVETADGATLFKPSTADSTISHLTVQNNSQSADPSYAIKLFGQKRVHDVAVVTSSVQPYGILASGSGGRGSGIDRVNVTVSGVFPFATTGYGIYNNGSDTPIDDVTITVRQTGDLTGYGVYNDSSEFVLSRADIDVGGTSNITAYGVYSIDSDIAVQDSDISATATSANIRVAAVYTTRTSGQPSTTITDSVLEGRATVGDSYGVFNTGNSAYAVITGSNVAGRTASVNGRAFLESSVVVGVVQSAAHVCFNVRSDTTTSNPTYTLLDATCN